jgi:uncharacterized protein (DUF1330 family)
MTYFVLVDIDIKDAERYRQYQASVRPMIEAAGGKYIVRGGEQTTYEGDLRLHRLVIFQWPSKEAHEAFFKSEAYQELKAIRLATATTSIVGIEGYQEG